MSKWKVCGPEITPTFTVHEDRIAFSPCGVTSYHREDMAHRFCALCHRFFEEDEGRCTVTDQEPAP